MELDPKYNESLKKAADRLSDGLKQKIELPPDALIDPVSPDNFSNKNGLLALDAASRAAGLGGAHTSAFSAFSGLNMIGSMPLLPPNTDHQGYTFFTRPCMNLSYDNVIKSRILAALADQSPLSTANAFRWMLTKSGMGDTIGDKNKSLMFPDYQPFMTLLSNTLLSMPGFQDFTPDIYTSNEGYAKEQVGFIDDKPTMYRAWSMTANFQNMEGDPLTTLFYIWTLYATGISWGKLAPFPLNITNNRIDYMTGIYRFTMDKTKRYIQNVAKTIAFPNVAPIGGVFNFDRTATYNKELDQISINFQCFGLEVQDPINIYEFNQVVYSRCPMMLPDSREKYMVKLNESEKKLFNYKAIPFVEDDNELAWYVLKDQYVATKDILSRSGDFYDNSIRTIE